MFCSSAFRQENYFSLKMYDCVHKGFIAVLGLLHKMQHNWHQLLKHNTAGRKENFSSWERKREFPTSICFVFVPSFCIPWESFKDHDYKTQEGVFGKLRHQTVAPKKGLQIDLSKNLLPSELMKSFDNEITRRCNAEEMKDLLQVLHDVGRCAMSPRNAGSDTHSSLCIHPTCSLRLQGTLTQPGQGKGTEIIRARWRHLVSCSFRSFFLVPPAILILWEISFIPNRVSLFFLFFTKKTPKMGRETEREKVSIPYLSLFWESWSYFTEYQDNTEKT